MTAKISRICIDEIYTSGQSKKFANLLYKYCYDNDICIDKDKSDILGYKGATVIEPSSGVLETLILPMNYSRISAL